MFKKSPGRRGAEIRKTPGKFLISAARRPGVVLCVLLYVVIAWQDRSLARNADQAPTL